MQAVQGSVYRFAGFSLDPGAGMLRKGGREIVLRPKSLELLTFLLRNTGRVISKDELLGSVWNDRIVTEDSLTQCVHDIRRALADDEQNLVRTVPRRGYLFPSEALEDQMHGPAFLETTASGDAGRPSIAVLPFNNMSADPSQEFFSDGITEDITTALCKLKGFFVIARNTMFTYKAKSVYVRAVGRELDVRYLLEGSVRKAGDRIRVTAQLIDVATGSHLWGDRYDRKFDDIFAIQDEITASVVGRIGPELFAAEHARARRKPPENLDSWECTLRALFLTSRLSEEDSGEALTLLDRAIATNPANAQALGLKAWTLIWRTAQGWHDRDRAIEEAASLSARALDADETEPWAWMGRGMEDVLMRRTAPAAAAFARAVDLNPNFAMAYGMLGLAHAFAGEADHAITFIDQASRLSPRELFHGAFAQQYAFAHFAAGSYALSLECAKRAHQLRPGHAYPLLIAASCAGHLGDSESAAALLATLKSVAPAISADWVEVNAPFVRAEDRRRLIAGLACVDFS
jgi:TolB-like protein